MQTKTRGQLVHLTGPVAEGGKLASIAMEDGSKALRFERARLGRTMGSTVNHRSDAHAPNWRSRHGYPVGNVRRS